MKNREMLMELKKVEPMFDKLADAAHEILNSKFGQRSEKITHFKI